MFLVIFFIFQFQPLIIFCDIIYEQYTKMYFVIALFERAKNILLLKRIELSTSSLLDWRSTTKLKKLNQKHCTIEANAKLL